MTQQQTRKKPTSMAFAASAMLMVGALVLDPVTTSPAAASPSDATTTMPANRAMLTKKAYELCDSQNVALKVGKISLYTGAGAADAMGLMGLATGALMAWKEFFPDSPLNKQPMDCDTEVPNAMRDIEPFIPLRDTVAARGKTLSEAFPSNRPLSLPHRVFVDRFDTLAFLEYLNEKNGKGSLYDNDLRNLANADPTLRKTLEPYLPR